MKPEQTRKLIQSCKSSKKTYLGSKTSILGVEGHVSVRDTHRVKHCLTTGATGTGKSQQLIHVAFQDIYKGYGLTIINSKGELLDEFLAKIPENRHDDLIYVNPIEEPITGINVLQPYTDRTASTVEKTNQVEIIVSNLIQLLKRRSNNWGDRFGRVFATLLRSGIRANIEYQTKYTLLDLKHWVTDNTELADLIDQTGDPELRSQLVTIKDSLSQRELEPLTRRLNEFTENQTVRRIIGQENSDIDFREVLDQQKILVVDVREGAVGTTVAELLTSTVITKLWAAAQTRYNHNHDCSPFYLFVDELQTFPTEGAHFAEVLSKAREYQLGCWLTTQYLAQLPAAMRNAVMNNCRTKLVFDPSGSEDLSKLTRMLRGIERDQLAALGDYRAVVQTPGTRTRTTATIVDTYPPWPTDETDLDRRKTAATAATDSDTTPQKPVLGKGVNAGGETHTELLATAKTQLEDRGLRVDLLYQDAGDDKPDGHIHLPTDEIAHLEAEHGTLSKPAKVLQNLLRAVDHGRECIFVVEEGNAKKLQQIVADPVNRHGTQFEDEQGRFDYYTGDGGESFTEVDRLEDAEYRILEATEDEIVLSEEDDSEPVDDDSEYETVGDELREIDHTVLRCIKRGKDDTHQITSVTDLPNHKVNYSFDKLEALGLVRVSDPETVERIIDGQKRVFDVKPVSLTSKAEKYFEWKIDNSGLVEILTRK